VERRENQKSEEEEDQYIPNRDLRHEKKMEGNQRRKGINTYQIET
jgi:hypothetical protein